MSYVHLRQLHPEALIEQRNSSLKSCSIRVSRKYDLRVEASVSQTNAVTAQKLLPAVDGFLKESLRIWDGKTHRELILGLMCLLPLGEFGGMPKPIIVFFKVN